MRLVRCRDQRSQTLDEFYEGLAAADDPAGRACGKAMLDLIAGLRAWPADDRKLWGMTSLNRLCLLAEDRTDAPLYVVVAAGPWGYKIEFLMSAATAPWPGASVHGEARRVDEAIDMIRTAMVRSGGWP